jgi:hypothetical protein
MRLQTAKTTTLLFLWTAEMTEITACRLLLTYLLRPVATGQPMTDKAFDEVIEEVKKHKAPVARDRLKDHEARR